MQICHCMYFQGSMKYVTVGILRCLWKYFTVWILRGLCKYVIVWSFKIAIQIVYFFLGTNELLEKIWFQQMPNQINTASLCMWTFSFVSSCLPIYGVVVCDYSLPVANVRFYVWDPDSSNGHRQLLWSRAAGSVLATMLSRLLVQPLQVCDWRT